jgi:trigger factor
MQITETLSQGLKRAYEITITSEEIEKKLTSHLEAIGKKVKMPGFRPGKVPLSLLKQRYRGEALSDALEDSIEKGIEKVLKDNTLKPSLKPKATIKSYEEGKDLVFEVSLEVLPTLGDIPLENLSFEKLAVVIPQDSITKTITNLSKHHRSSRPIEKERKTQKGDIAIINFKGFIDDTPIKGGEGKNHALELGSGSFIPGFEDQLIGQDKGAHVQVKVTFPEHYHEESYANKPARFEVEVIDIHEADPLEINEELAEKLGFESLEVMNDWVKGMLSKDYDTQSFIHTKRHVLDALAERFSFEVPENMVDLEFKNIWAQLCREIGVDESKTDNTNAEGHVGSKTFKEATGKEEEELRAEYKTIAIRRVRLGILLAEIGNRNNITVNNQELMKAIVARAQDFPGQEKQVFDFYRSNEAAMASLRAPLFEDKVIDYILSQSTVTEKEVSPEELEKLLSMEEEEAEKKIESEAKKQKKPAKGKKSEKES